jgi:hypothetical protein
MVFSIPHYEKMINGMDLGKKAILPNEQLTSASLPIYKFQYASCL